MSTDIVLDSNDVTHIANDTHFKRSDGDGQSSASLNLSNDTGEWHLSGPRTYEAGNPLSIFWHHMQTYAGPMLSITTEGIVKLGARLVSDKNGRVGIGTAQPETSLHVHGEEVHATGPVGGYSFADRDLPGKASDSAPGQRWVWYAKAAKARLWSGSDKLVVTGSGRVGVGTDEPESGLHVHGEEVHATGATGGYSFADRTIAGKTNDASPGQRWVWYAQGRAARLWNRSDKLVVSPSGALTAGGGVGLAGGNIYLPGLTPDPATPSPPTPDDDVVFSVGDLLLASGTVAKTSVAETVASKITVGGGTKTIGDFVVQNDLRHAILSLRDRVAALETEVASLTEKQPAPA